MKKTSLKENSRFPKSFFWIILGILLLVAGLQMGILVGMAAAKCSAIIQAHVMVFYWIGATLLLTKLLKSQLIKVYDTPMHNISTATK